MTVSDDQPLDASERAYSELVDMLRQRAVKAAPASSQEQDQILARVRLRLQRATEAAELEETREAQEEERNMFAPLPVLVNKSTKRTGPARRAISMIAAVLVVAVISGASFLLFTHYGPVDMMGGHPIATGKPIGPMKEPMSLRSNVEGLEATMRITPGPYFISELLAVDITITNRSSRTANLFGSKSLGGCNSAFSLEQIGGGEPRYPLPTGRSVMSCPPMMSEIKVGETVRVHGYIALTASGQVTLKASANIRIGKTDGQENSFQPLSQFKDDWLTLHLTVLPTIPGDRKLTYHQEQRQITIEAPSSVRKQLVYYQVMQCTNSIHIEGGMGWVPLKETRGNAILQSMPPCDTSSWQWQYAIGAPGYGVIAGELNA